MPCCFEMRRRVGTAHLPKPGGFEMRRSQVGAHLPMPWCYEMRRRTSTRTPRAHARVRPDSRRSSPVAPARDAAAQPAHLPMPALREATRLEMWRLHYDAHLPTRPVRDAAARPLIFRCRAASRCGDEWVPLLRKSSTHRRSAEGPLDEWPCSRRGTCVHSSACPRRVACWMPASYSYTVHPRRVA